MKIKVFNLIIFICCLSIQVHANNPEKISLDGIWRFAIDSTNSGEKGNWQNELPISSSIEVRVPHTWNISQGTEDYNGSAWYQKQFEAPIAWRAKNIRIKFDAVYHDAVVYVNGKKVGSHFNSGYTPFEIGIDSLVKYNETNKIVVWVNNQFSENMFPYKKSFDWVNDGGIIRSVALHISGKPSLKYVHVDSKFSLNDSIGSLLVSVKLWEKKFDKTNIKLVIKDKQTGRIVYTTTKVLKTKNNIFKTTIDLGKIKLWHFDQPNLYTIETTLISKSEISDSNTATFGFKKLELKGDKLYLNGENVRLPGIEYMPGSNPDYGLAESHAFMDSVVKTMKNLNVCITRFHWQQDDYLLSLMDENGILVQEELPWWQSPGNPGPSLLKTARRQLADNIEAHYNHPCIFSWGVSNEVYGNTDKNIYTGLRDYIKSIDSTRLVTVVSNEINNRKKNDESLFCDLPTWNEYIGTWFGNDRNVLPDKFDIVKEAIGNRPLLITENGLCEPRFNGGDSRRIDELLFHTKEWCRQKFVIGYIYFCLNDYRTHAGEEGLGKFKIRRHGITDIFLNPKPSYSVFKQIASPIEIIKVERVKNSAAHIGIKIKNEIPSYTIKNYYISYRTENNKVESISLPVLKPGAIYEFDLNKINPRFEFEILRQNGASVIKY